MMVLLAKKDLFGNDAVLEVCALLPKSLSKVFSNLERIKSSSSHRSDMYSEYAGDSLGGLERFLHEFCQATIMCDFITLNLLKRREIYRERKYEQVEVEDEVVSAFT